LRASAHDRRLAPDWRIAKFCVSAPGCIPGAQDATKRGTPPLSTDTQHTQ
jgi:hypothetical protein